MARKIVGLTMSEELHDELKILAIKNKINLGDLIEKLLRKSLQKAGGHA